MTPLIRPIKQSKLNCKKNNVQQKHRGGSSHYRTPQLNNRTENQTVKKKQNLGCFFDVHTTLMMRWLIM